MTVNAGDRWSGRAAPRPATAPDPIRVTGHRGAMAHAPENTVLSLVTAEQLEVDEIEFDVRVSADGVAVISHDDDLGRVLGTGEAHRVSETEWRELQSLRLPRGQRLLSLAEAIELTQADLQIEIKVATASAATAAVLADYPDERRRCLLTSFRPEILADLRRLAPGVPRGLITARWRPEIHGQLRSLGCAAVFSGWEGLSSEVVADLRSSGFRVGGWPLRTSADARRALELSVDSVTADDPALARDWLSTAGRRLRI